MLQYLSPGADARRFLPLSALVSFAGVVVLGRQLDSFTVATLIVLVPLAAYALSLLFVPAIRLLSSPERVLLRLSEEVTKQYAKKFRIPRIRRERIRQSLVAQVRPLVADQSDQFWTLRAKGKDSQLDRQLEKHEIGLFSLGILGGTYSLSGITTWLLFVSNPPSIVYYESLRVQLAAGAVLAIVGLIFLAAFDRERATYRRLLWEQIPLLMTSPKGPDAAYWGRRTDFIEARRSKIGDAVANRLVEEAEERRRLALKGELERDWIRHLFEREASEESKIAKELLGYLLKAQRAESEAQSFSIPAILILILTISASILLVIASESSDAFVPAGAILSIFATVFGFVIVILQRRHTLSAASREGPNESP